MKILFLYPEYSYPRKNPPIGIASLAGFIIAQGQEVKIIDFNIRRLDKDELRTDLEEFAPDFIGISFMTNQYVKAVELMRLCKKVFPETILLAGGPHASALPEELLKEVPELDIVIYGEGEIPLKKLIETFETNCLSDVTKVPNICFRDNENMKIIKNPPTTEVFDFRTPPRPAWHLLDLTKYRVFSAGGDSSKMTFALLSSRGCPGRCVFCDSHTIFGRKFRGRTAEDIFKEVMFLHKTYNMDQFDFVDDLVTLDKKRIFDFCALILSSGIKFRWMANARINTLSEEMLLKMKEAGCVRIELGVESGDPSVRKLMKKDITNEQIVKILKLCKKMGFYTGTFLMVGNLGETKASVKMTVKLMKGLTDDPSIAIACPYPGTELYKILDKKGYILTKDWSKYGTAPTFLKGYKPVMRTDEMTSEEIMEAYYYLQSFFAIDKFRSRYGRYFYFNLRFIKEYLLKNKQYGGFMRKAMMGFRLLANLLRRFVFEKSHKR